MLGFHCHAGFSLVAVSRGYSVAAVSRVTLQLRCADFLISVASLFAEHGPVNMSSVVVALRLLSTGSVAAQNLKAQETVFYDRLTWGIL